MPGACCKFVVYTDLRACLARLGGLLRCLLHPARSARVRRVDLAGPRAQGEPRPGHSAQQWVARVGPCAACATPHSCPAAVHGDPTLGYEVMPSNAAYTAAHLGLAYEEWDSAQPAPQSAAYKAWLKRHLSAGHPVAWFPICKGDPHECYPDSCPAGGSCDHVEPMGALYSSHPLDDPTVYDDGGWRRARVVVSHVRRRGVSPARTTPVGGS